MICLFISDFLFKQTTAYELRISDWSSDVCSSDLLLATGRDPAEQARLEKAAASIAAANTFKAVAEEWLAKVTKEGLSPATLKKNRWLLDFSYQFIGHRPIAEIKPFELLTLLRKYETKGKHETALRLRRSEEHTSELQSLMRISSAVFCLKKKNNP